MLTFTGSDEKQQNTGFHLLGTVRHSSHTNLISDNTSLISENTSLILSSNDYEGGMDTCSFYSGPSDETILSFGEQAESCGSIAYDSSAESCGSIAYTGGGVAGGAISSASVSTGTSCGGGCSYSC